MRIALAQINPIIGDIVGNTEIIRRYIARAREAGARLVVFPELALVGYPPRDLLLKDDLVAANLAALEVLAPETQGIAALVGYVDRNESSIGRPLYNALALLDGGRLAAKKHKTLLPTYDVFDEARYFEPGPAAAVAEVGGLRLGLSICEDIWNPEDHDIRNLYPQDPIAAIAAARPDVIVNISASPFILGKYDTRLALLRRQAAAHGLPVLYCNQVGGNDELIFDGASLALAADGRIIAQGRDFEEDLVIVELPAASASVGAAREPPFVPIVREGGSRAAPTTANELHPPRTGVASLHGALVLGLRDYFRKCGFTDAVLGLSGGIDSAIVVCLAAEALGPSHVLAVALPSRYSADQSLTDARTLAENLGVEFRVIPIGEVHQAFEATLKDAFAGRAPDIAEENIQARIRGVILMALSNKFGKLLLATGNKSELAAGYCTLYGDMCGGLAPIGDVPKGMVYQLARYINDRATATTTATARTGTSPVPTKANSGAGREIIPEAILVRPPTAELKPNQTDQDTLPPYDLVDQVVELYVEDLLSVDGLVASGVPRETAERMVRMIDAAEYKRRQAAPVLKVTGRAFGMGRRMPIAKRYRPR